MNILPKISVPKYRLDVPSTGKNVEYRPYLVKEEKVLLIAVASEDPNQIQDAIADIIKECCPSIGDLHKLTTADIEYIFLMLRSISVGAKIDIIKVCEHCDSENDVQIDLTKIKIENDGNEKDLRVDVDQNFKIDLMYPTLSPILNSNEDDEQFALITTVANCIETIYYGEDTYSMDGISVEEKVDFVGNLSSIQFSKLVAVLLNAPYVAYESKYKCKSCGEENDIYYTGLIDFFI